MPRRTAHLNAPADFGLAIQQARMELGLSQTDIADQIGVSQSAISEIESGKATIHLRRLLSLARITGVELTATWGDDDAPGR